MLAMDQRAKLKQLIAEKDKMEGEIKELNEVLSSVRYRNVRWASYLLLCVKVYVKLRTTYFTLVIYGLCDIEISITGDITLGLLKYFEALHPDSCLNMRCAVLCVFFFQHGMGMSEPLVDSEGYPRNDIDVYQVRVTRNRISCLQNDHKNLMKVIEEELHVLHSENKTETMDVDPGLPTVEMSITEPEPFATINLVSPGSPAELAGLCVGDEVIHFGSVNKSNFQSLQSVATVVQHSEEKTVEVKVRKNGRAMRLLLTPKKWSGRGLLGCNIVPITR